MDLTLLSKSIKVVEFELSAVLDKTRFENAVRGKTKNINLEQR